MATKTRCISVSEDDDILLEEMNISPSALIKSKIEEIRLSSKITLGQLDEANRKISSWMALARKYQAFLESKGLLNEVNGILA